MQRKIAYSGPNAPLKRPFDPAFNALHGNAFYTHPLLTNALTNQKGMEDSQQTVSAASI
jgi:hypothetical protein